jgi:phage-related protein
MLANADNAWKTAGLSANEYMETAIASSAALISSLNGDADKAAGLMDQSITDMSDNVNKMGTTMEAVQNAYRGFSRGNFTMLDNLALGFAGTKEGMQQLLDKAQELSGVEFNIDSYADIVQAIHVVQESMGIAGTTAKEATETIQGSMNAMKSAWKNVLVAIADDNADFDQVLDNFLNSIITVGDNIIPRITSILNGASKLVVEASKKLLPVVIQTIIDNLPTLIEAGMELLTALVTGLLQAIPQLVMAIPDIISAIIEGLKAGWPGLKEAGKQALEAVVLGLAEGVWYLWAALADISNSVIDKLNDSINEGISFGRDKLKQMSDTVLQWLNKESESIAEKTDKILDTMSSYYEQGKKLLVDAVRNRISTITDYLNKQWSKITGFYDDVMNKVRDFLEWLYEHTIGKLKDLKDGIIKKFEQMRDGIAVFIDEAKAWGRDLILNFADGLAEAFPLLSKAANGIATVIGKFIHFSEPDEGPLKNFHTFAPDMMELFAKGIKDNEWRIKDQLASSLDFSSVNIQPQFNGAMAGNTSTTYNYFTIDGIEQLSEVVDWFENRQVVARMG